MGVTPGIKVFTVLTGNTLGSHESFWKLLANHFDLVKVPVVEDCDVTLAFCPIVSRVGTDIGAALPAIPGRWNSEIPAAFGMCCHNIVVVVVQFKLQIHTCKIRHFVFELSKLLL